MMHREKEIENLASEFAQCQKILLALGDANRLHMILEMMQMNECAGVRVNAIKEKTHLSRPAVSHHLQILKDAGVLKMRREGTKNYYYFDPDMKSFKLLIDVLQNAVEIASELPDRSAALQNAEEGF